MPTMQTCVAILIIALRFGAGVLAQDQQVQFNQVVNLNGDMQLNRLTFPDGSKIETFSQEQRQILVNQNPAPLPANRVIGSTGQPFIQMTSTSMTIATNNATDLVGAQIEMAIPQQMLQAAGVSASNTFVAKLSQDRQTWTIVESVKSVNATDSTVRMVKQTSIDGEYMLLGRRTPETSQVLSAFGGDSARSVQVNGSGIQELQFSDGFKMTVRTVQPMTVNTDVVNSVSTSMLVDSTNSVNNYRYLVTTNLAAVQPGLNQMMALIQMPINAERLMAMAQRMGAGPTDQVSLGIEQRPVLANPGGAVGNLQPNQPNQKRQKTSTTSAADGTQTDAPNGNNSTSSSTDGANTSTSTTTGTSQQTPTPDQNQNQGQNNQPPSPAQGGNPVATQLLLAPTFTPVSSKNVLDRQNGRLAAMVNQLDGEFIVTMALAKNGQQPPQQGQPQQGQPQQGQPQQGQPQQGQPQQGQLPQQSQIPTQSLGSAPGGALPGAVETPRATPLPGRPAKRQLSPAPAANKVLMSMAELAEMVQSQKSGGSLQVTAMMEEYARSQGRTIAAPASNGLTLRSPVAAESESRAAQNVRAVKFSG